MEKTIIRTLILLVLCSLVFAQQPINIAVLNLEAVGVSKSESLTLSERLRYELVNAGKFKLIERSKMDEILQEQGFQQSGCTTDECAVEIGRLLNVQQIVAGSVGKVGNLYTVTLRMIDVQTGEILLSITEDCDCPVEQVLTRSMNNVALKLAERAGRVNTKTGNLMITTDPPDIPVYVDGQEIGNSPLNYELDYGSYEVLVGGKDFRAEKRNIQIDKPEINAWFSLARRGGTVGLKNIRPGTRIKIDGIGTRFDGDVFVSAGRHEISFDAPGFETKRNSFEMEDGQQLTFSAQLQPKTVSAAVWRSALLPGWGQYYQEKSWTAVLYPLTFAGTVAAAILTESSYKTAVADYDDIRAEYQSAYDPKQIERLRTDMHNKWDTVNNKESLRNGLIITAGAVWLWNVLDTFLLPPEFDNTATLSIRQNDGTFSAGISFALSATERRAK